MLEGIATHMVERIPVGQLGLSEQLVLLWRCLQFELSDDDLLHGLWHWLLFGLRPVCYQVRPLGYFFIGVLIPASLQELQGGFLTGVCLDAQDIGSWSFACRHHLPVGLTQALGTLLSFIQTIMTSI
jgi:hypothetical protein